MDTSSTTRSISRTNAGKRRPCFIVGADKADDPAGHLYYLQRVFLDTTGRKVNVLSSLPSAALAWEPKHPPSLIVVTTEPSAENVRRLQEYVRGGGTLLYVVTAPGRAESLATLADVTPSDVEEAIVSRDVMLGEIAFDHPLFAPLAAAQFNDFTKIHFWKYRRLDPKSLGEARVLARFENGDAAVVEKAMGKGRLVVMTSGWQPVDSQLARSSKFVPLMAALLEGREPRPLDATSYLVHDRVPLPVMEKAAAALIVHKPDGTVVKTTPDGAVLCRDGSARSVHGRHAWRRAVLRREPRSDGEQDGPFARGNAGAARLPAGEPYPQKC